MISYEKAMEKAMEKAVQFADTVDKLRMAACGVDCGECASYKVTMEQDLKEAEKLVGWYRDCGWIEKDEGAEAVLKKNPLCKGCWNVTEDCFFKCGCGSRDFRVCCTEKQIDHCGECEDFPCEHFNEWVQWTSSHDTVEYLLSLKKQK